MNDEDQAPALEPKRPYRKPEISKVPLRPSDAVLGGCKSTSIGGPTSPTCGGTVACMSPAS